MTSLRKVVYFLIALCLGVPLVLSMLGLALRMVRRAMVFGCYGIGMAFVIYFLCELPRPSGPTAL